MLAQRKMAQTSSIHYDRITRDAHHKKEQGTKNRGKGKRNNKQAQKSKDPQPNKVIKIMRGGGPDEEKKDTSQTHRADNNKYPWAEGTDIHRYLTNQAQMKENQPVPIVGEASSHRQGQQLAEVLKKHKEKGNPKNIHPNLVIVTAGAETGIHWVLLKKTGKESLQIIDPYGTRIAAVNGLINKLQEEGWRT